MITGSTGQQGKHWICNNLSQQSLVAGTCVRATLIYREGNRSLRRLQMMCPSHPANMR